MILRQNTWPHSLNAGTTHDTKRGEDSRIRLCWLSSIPEEWITSVSRWREMNRGFIAEEKGRPAPLPNDEYFMYQSLLGGFPADLVLTDEFRTRFHDMLTKALREAKTATSWDTPDEGYEGKCHAFADAILAGESSFMKDFLPFAGRCVNESMRYSLSQLLLKLTAPGIPDIYQGAECWELSFVDPDNRRPVDYALREELLKRVKEGRIEGAEKMYVIRQTLAWRNTHREVFTTGEYIPIDVAGPYLAFVRHHEKDWVLVIVPLIRMGSATQEKLAVRLPEGAPADWTNVFTGEVHREEQMNGVLEKFAVAMLTGSTE
jgi:(1->4)-alpha-D-glucan 1-alpha-D-glucosylmutase